MVVVERERELSLLRSVLDSVGAPEARALAVVGVPGIGKSALLSVVVEECSDWLILSARGTPLGAQVPYGMLVQLFGGLARSAVKVEHPFDGPGGVLRDLVINGAVGADAAALSYSLHWVVARLAEDNRVLIVADDLHWADSSSLTILGNAMGLLSSERVGFLFGVRSTPRELAGPVLSAVLDVSTIISPATLSLAGTAAIVERSGVGTEGKPLDVARIHELSGGVPFYVTELVAMGLAGQELTSSIQVIESIGGRLDRLGEGHREVASAVAVLGSEASRMAVSALSGIAEEKLPPLVSALTAEGILSDSNRLEPAHPLVGEAIRSGLGAIALAVLHDRAAGILHSLGVAGTSVAAHILHSPVGQVEWRVAVLTSAGRAALAAGSAEDAVACLDRALREMREDDPQRHELLEDAATASLASGKPMSAVAHWREALALVRNMGARTRILADLGNALFDAGEPVAAEAAYAQGTRELTAAGIATTEPIFREFVARGLSVRLSLAHSPSVFAKDVVQQTIEQRPKFDTPEDARLLAAAVVGLALSGAPAERTRELALRAYLRWPRSNTNFADDPATYHLSAVLNVTSLFDECDELLTSAVEEARTRGRVLSEATARYCRGSLYFSQGDIRHAVPDLVAAVNAVQLGWLRYRESAEAILIRCHIAIGDNAAAGQIARAKEYESSSDMFRSIQYLGRSDYWTRVGRPSRGLELAYRARDLVPVGMESFGFGWRASAGDALFAHGDRAGARKLAYEEVALAESSGHYVSALGPALFRLARSLDNDNDAIEVCTRAITIMGPLRRYAQLHVRHLLADLLAKRGDIDGAVEMLEHSLDYVQSQRLVPAEKRVRSALVSIGHPVVPSSLERRVASLSPSEFRVATLAAQGLSNREIAGNLFVTLKTVEFHLSHCYRKLGIPARRDLAETLSPEVVVG